ncbi:oxidized pyrimidine nucleobase lesion DNA N-glycosylase [Aureococcus anophagefferens]|uniref:Oxidized pyrimidine nucleobase lesion DNA N-glycosylase n=1 Tax=Aureococcus anophagefferens TaxID=44056 RepID=A0ABR1FVW3_AURAN
MPLRFTMLLVLTKAFLRSPAPRATRRVVARAATNGGEWALPSGWRAALGDELASDRFRDLQAFVAAERASQTVYPPPDDETPRAAIRRPRRRPRLRRGAGPVPRPRPGQRPRLQRLRRLRHPPSLRNVLRECAEDHGAAPAGRRPRGWADQGVLLLNTALTVREGEAHSHRGRGWERLTDAVVAALAARSDRSSSRSGATPRGKAAIVDGTRHRVVASSHPSPLSCAKTAAPFRGAVARSAPLAAAAAREAPRSRAARRGRARRDDGLLDAVFLDADEPDDDRGAGPLCGWRTFDDQLAALEAFRRKGGAPVDLYGCQTLGDRSAPPHVFRFQTLVALILSARTTDEATMSCVRDLQWADGGLTADTLAAADASTLERALANHEVAFPRNKARYLRRAAELCRDSYGGDVPRDLPSIRALPGVGDKVAALLTQAAWGDDAGGVAVDTHFHRIANRLGWVATATAAATKRDVEAFLPRDRWVAANPLLVGFGQEVCGYAPDCASCPVAACPRVGVDARPPPPGDALVDADHVELLLDRAHRDFDDVVASCASVGRHAGDRNAYVVLRSKFDRDEPDQPLARITSNSFGAVGVVLENLRGRRIKCYARRAADQVPF